MPLPDYWVHDLDPFLVRFSENFGIRYYGLAYLAGFAAAFALLVRYWKAGRSPHGPAAVGDLVTALVIGVLAGGRLGYFLLYHPATLGRDPLIFFRVWEGGMASHGGMVGVLVALWWWCRQRKTPLLPVADLVVSVAPAGLFFGRIANFINGELVGKITAVKWAVIFPHNEIDRGLLRAMPRHPSQLYQAALEGLLLLAYLQWRFWRSRACRDHPGHLSGEFLIAYAVVRTVGELFREPDASLLFGLSRGTFYSVFLVAAGAWLIAHSRKVNRSGPAPAA